MSLRRSALRDLGLPEAGFALAWLVALLCVIPVQLASMIVFDSTGLDALVPHLVFMALVPAAVLALVPALVARRLYARRATRLTAAVAFAAFALLTSYTARFYRVCGPNC